MLQILYLCHWERHQLEFLFVRSMVLFSFRRLLVYQYTHIHLNDLYTSSRYALQVKHTHTHTHGNTNNVSTWKHTLARHWTTMEKE